ncbi:MAG: ABC transporter substrate-binding protein [Eubacteriales bacterium]|nr:ABC transporter substrate-binding protein [Eubacteriales bacterium]
MKKSNIVPRVLTVAMAAIIVLAVSGCAKKNSQKEFTPRLDTGNKVVLDVMGFFNNFEAFDQVTNDFNVYYPNVTFNYEQVGADNLTEYLDSNPGVDIFMTSDVVVMTPGNSLAQKCVDLSQENIDFSAIDKSMIKADCYENRLVAIPMSQNLYGVVVNVSLLEKEGLSVPQTYSEFLDALKVLKDKGYVPIQGPSGKVYAELTIGMLYNIIGNDDELYNKLLAGDSSAEEKIAPVFDIIDTITENGYTDAEVNDAYPNDNYDGAIMKFFEGEVPFWVCNTEKVSGMKKRETKSEAYKEAPFEYTYIFVPMGENGAYVYREPWYGFSVSEKSDVREYAVEFMRFLATKDEINKIADVKGVPSVAVEHTDIDIYKNMIEPSKVEAEFVKNDGIRPELNSVWYSVTYRYASGQYPDKKAAVDDFISQCSALGNN